MISNILKNAPHLAISACNRGEDDYTTIVKVLAALIAQRVPLNLDKLYGSRAYAPDMIEPAKKISGSPIKVIIGGIATSLEGRGQLEVGMGNAEFGIVEDTEQLEGGLRLQHCG